MQRVVSWFGCAKRFSIHPCLARLSLNRSTHRFHIYWLQKMQFRENKRFENLDCTEMKRGKFRAYSSKKTENNKKSSPVWHQLMCLLPWFQQFFIQLFFVNVRFNRIEQKIALFLGIYPSEFHYNASLD